MPLLSVGRGVIISATCSMDVRTENGSDYRVLRTSPHVLRLQLCTRFLVCGSACRPRLLMFHTVHFDHHIFLKPAACYRSLLATKATHMAGVPAVVKAPQLALGSSLSNSRRPCSALSSSTPRAPRLVVSRGVRCEATKEEQQAKAPPTVSSAAPHWLSAQGLALPPAVAAGSAARVPARRTALFSDPISPHLPPAYSHHMLCSLENN